MMSMSETGREPEVSVPGAEPTENLEQLYAESFKNLQEGSLVNGVVIVKDGQLQAGVFPGRPVRAPF